jgi:hypothetical protein
MENSAVSIPEKKAEITAQTASPANVATANSVDMLVIGSLGSAPAFSVLPFY